MESRPAVDPGRGRVEPEGEHQVSGVEPLVENRFRQVSVIPGVSEKGRATDPPRGPPSPLCSSAVSSALTNRTRAGLRAASRSWTSRWPNFSATCVRRHAEAERPAVDVEGRDRRISRLVDARGDAGRVARPAGALPEPTSPRRAAMKMSGVAPRSSRTPADVRAIDQRVLRRRGLVIDAGHIDPCAAVQQEVGDRDGLRLMERLLTIASSRVHECAVGVNSVRSSSNQPRRAATFGVSVAPCARRKRAVSSLALSSTV